MVNIILLMRKRRETAAMRVCKINNTRNVCILFLILKTNIYFTFKIISLINIIIYHIHTMT